MSDRVQPGARVDREVYERFQRWVAQRYGKTRGVLGEELERAMKARMEAGARDEQLDRIEDDLATLKAIMADSDGGTDAPLPAEDASGTPARGDACRVDAPGEKPASNQPRGAKVRWLAARIDSADGSMTTEADLADRIRDHYDFSDGVISDYVDRVLDRLDAEVVRRTPVGDPILAWGPRLDQVRDEQRQDAADAAHGATDRLDDASPARD